MTQGRIGWILGSVGLLIVTAALILIASRGRDATGDRGWLADDQARQRDQLERHLRGLDVAMMEIGYRFDQLHVAGEVGNWPYARYQIEKIELALGLALERRPKREASARPFLDETILFVKQAIDQAARSGDATGYSTALDRLRSDCMMCHVREEVPYMPVRTKASRLTEPDDF